MLDLTAGVLVSGVGILVAAGLLYDLATGSLPQSIEGLDRPKIVVVAALLVLAFLGFGLWVLSVAVREWRARRE